MSVVSLHPTEIILQNPSKYSIEELLDYENFAADLSSPLGLSVKVLLSNNMKQLVSIFLDPERPRRNPSDPRHNSKLLRKNSSLILSEGNFDEETLLVDLSQGLEDMAYRGKFSGSSKEVVELILQILGKHSVEAKIPSNIVKQLCSTVGVAGVHRILLNYLGHFDATFSFVEVYLEEYVPQSKTSKNSKDNDGFVQQLDKRDLKKDMRNVLEKNIYDILKEGKKFSQKKISQVFDEGNLIAFMQNKLLQDNGNKEEQKNIFNAIQRMVQVSMQMRQLASESSHYNDFLMEKLVDEKFYLPIFNKVFPEEVEVYKINTIIIFIRVLVLLENKEELINLFTGIKDYLLASCASGCCKKSLLLRYVSCFYELSMGLNILTVEKNTIQVLYDLGVECTQGSVIANKAIDTVLILLDLYPGVLQYMNKKVRQAIESVIVNENKSVAKLLYFHLMERIAGEEIYTPLSQDFANHPFYLDYNKWKEFKTRPKHFTSKMNALSIHIGNLKKDYEKKSRNWSELLL